MERSSPFPTRYTCIYGPLHSEQRSLFTTKPLCVTYISSCWLWVGQDARPTKRGYCWVSRFPVQPNLRVDIWQHALVIKNLSEPVGRDSYLDTQTSILENRPTVGNHKGCPYSLLSCRMLGILCSGFGNPLRAVFFSRFTLHRYSASAIRRAI